MILLTFYGGPVDWELRLHKWQWPLRNFKFEGHALDADIAGAKFDLFSASIRADGLTIIGGGSFLFKSSISTTNAIRLVNKLAFGYIGI